MAKNFLDQVGLKGVIWGGRTLTMVLRGRNMAAISGSFLFVKMRLHFLSMQ